MGSRLPVGKRISVRLVVLAVVLAAVIVIGGLLLYDDSKRGSTEQAWQIQRTGVPGSNPSCSPASGLIAFEQYNSNFSGDSEVEFLSREAWVCTMDASGKKWRRIFSGVGPNWIRDGKALGFYSAGKLAIYESETNMLETPRALTTCARPVWLPDGSGVFFVGSMGFMSTTDVSNLAWFFLKMPENRIIGCERSWCTKDLGCEMCVNPGSNAYAFTWHDPKRGPIYCRVGRPADVMKRAPLWNMVKYQSSAAPASRLVSTDHGEDCRVLECYSRETTSFDRRTLTAGMRAPGHPSWHPLRLGILFTERSAVWQSTVMDPEQKSKPLRFWSPSVVGRVLRRERPLFACWSPDAEKVAILVARGKGSASILVTDAQGKNQQIVTEDAALPPETGSCHLAPFCWDANGRIVFTAANGELCIAVNSR